MQPFSSSRQLSVVRSALSRSIRLIPSCARSYIKRAPILSWLQRKLLVAFLEGHEFVHRIDTGPAKGLFFPVILPDDKGVWTGSYERRFVDALASSILPGTTCFDVGGWHGYCGGVMACAGAAKTYVFEPLPSNCARIRRVIDLNPHLNITLEQVA